MGSPLVSLALPVVTKDVAVIWWANFAVVAVSYLYAYFLKQPSSEEEMEGKVEGEDSDVLDGKETNAVGSLLIRAFKALDYGSGQERGARRKD